MMERIEKMKVSDDALDLVFHVSDLKISNLTKNNIWSPSRYQDPVRSPSVSSRTFESRTSENYGAAVVQTVRPKQSFPRCSAHLTP